MTEIIKLMNLVYRQGANDMEFFRERMSTIQCYSCESREIQIRVASPDVRGGKFLIL